MTVLRPPPRGGLDDVPLRAFAAAGGNKAEAARLPGIARRTLYSRLAGERPRDGA